MTRSELEQLLRAVRAVLVEHVERLTETKLKFERMRVPHDRNVEE